MLLHFKRESSEYVQIRFEDRFVGEFTLLSGHWYCTLNMEMNRQSFEEILRRFQLLHGFEPPYYKDGKIIVTTATGALRRAEFPVGEFVQINKIQVDNTCVILTQTKEEGIRRIITLDTEEDIIGAVEYGKGRILAKSTHADPG